MTIQTTKIPRRQKCVNKEHPYIGGAKDVIDDELGKPQSEVNQETNERVSTLEEAVGTGGSVDERINAEKERAEGVEATHSQQIADLQAMEQIVIDGGEAQIAQGSDFDNPDSAKRAKIPTVGAVLDGISEGVFDLTAKTGDSYASLQDALTAANTAIPANKKKGGMQLSFVHSVDNKYIQARCMAQNFTTDVTQWQGVDDEPTAESDNLVKSGGVYKECINIGKGVNPVSVLNSVKLTVSGNTLTFESGGNSLVCYKKYGRNEVFNFYQRTVANVTSLLTDDVAPVHVAIGEDKQYTVIGANHGWPYAKNATITAHGKTNTDIGTLWVDSQNHKYVLADIVNANTLTFLPQNNGNYINIDLEPGMTVGTITCNGNTMTVSNVTEQQLRNSVSNKTLHIFDSNNEEIIDDGVYEADYFDVKESYDITNLASIINNLISRQSQTPKPTATPDYSGMAMLNVDNTYRIGNNTTVVVEATVSPKHLVYLNGGDIMFTQAQYLITGEENIKYYVPGSKPYGRNLTSPAPWVFNEWAFEAVIGSFADVDKPINRIIQYAQAYGFALGYLNYTGVGKNIMGYTSMPLKVRGDSGKIYPHGIDGAKIGTTINIPNKYTAVMYRAVVDYSTKNANRLSYYTVDAPNGYLYLYIDYSASTNDTIILNDKYNGKSIEVVESSNCKLLYDVYYGGIFIKSTYITDRTSYMIVRISNN